jgi:hypothetical protein
MVLHRREWLASLTAAWHRVPLVAAAPGPGPFARQKMPFPEYQARTLSNIVAF